MKSLHPSKRYLFIIISIILLALVMGCSDKNKNFSVLIYSNIPSEANDEIKNNIKPMLMETFDDIEINILPVFRERLIVEIAAHSGDVFFIERELLPTIMYPEGLYPLEEIQNPEDLENVSELQGQDEEGNIHLYAVPVSVTSIYPNWEYEPSHELVALVPVYTENREEAFRVLSQLIKEK